MAVSIAKEITGKRLKFLTVIPHCRVFAHVYVAEVHSLRSRKQQLRNKKPKLRSLAVVWGPLMFVWFGLVSGCDNIPAWKQLERGWIYFVS